MPASRGTAPRTGMPSGASARRSIVSWRALPTRFRITPAISTSGSCRAKPATSGATDWDIERASTTRTTGSRKSRARSAEAPRPSGGAPSKSPIHQDGATVAPSVNLPGFALGVGSLAQTGPDRGE